MRETALLGSPHSMAEGFRAQLYPAGVAGLRIPWHPAVGQLGFSEPVREELEAAGAVELRAGPFPLLILPWLLLPRWRPGSRPSLGPQGPAPFCLLAALQSGWPLFSALTSFVLWVLA